MKKLFSCGILSVFFLFLSVAHGEDFFPTNAVELQNALSSALSNDEDDTINLAEAVYATADLGASFHYDSSKDDSLTLIGAGMGKTILDGAGFSDRVMILEATGTGANISVQGITFQNGDAGTLVEGAGLALLNTDGNSTVEGCEFKDNIDAINGGGAAVMASGNITVIDNTFTGNEASGGEGGGIFLFNSTSGVPGSVSFINNVLSGNTAASGGGALIRSDKNIGDGTIDIINNSFSGNTAVGEGGGLFFAPSGNPVPMNIYNNIFFGNEATPEQGMDVRFVNNSGPQTFALVSLFNNNWGEFCLNNFAEPADNCDPVASLNSQFGTAVDNLPNVDPLFVNAAAGDLRLQENSPLIDEGSAAAPSLPATDHDGDPRIFGPAPDMGAFEFQPEPTPSPTPPPQDGGGCSLQGNGTPGYFLILFLLLVISSWGVRLRD